MKQYLGKDGAALGEVLDEYKSKSSPGKFHQVRKSYRDGKIYCSCPGWIHKARKSDGICKHIALFKGAKPTEAVVIYSFDEFTRVKRGFSLITDATVSQETKVRRS